MSAAPPPPPAAPRRGRLRRRSTVSVLVAALGAGMLSLAPAVRADTVDPAVGDAQHQAQFPPAGAPDTPATIAQAKAKATGKPVAIDALTTPYAQTFANPDGTLETLQSADVQRAKVNGSWTAVDADLQAAPGGLAPKAAVDPLLLSAGGAGPLATLTDPSGHTLALSMPFALPAPTVSGDTATYAEVLPGVDLAVTATVEGGIQEVLVVKNAAAAANPALTALKIATTGPGLTVSTNAISGLQATGADGAIEFIAPASQMWDSSTTSPTGTATSTPAAANALTGHGMAVQADSIQSADSAAPAAASSINGPGSGAQSAVIPTSVSGSTVTLTPDATILHGPGTQFPVYVDPEWLPWSNSTPSWTWTQSAHPTYNNMGHTGTQPSDHPGVGVCGYYANGGSCVPSDKERSYFQFNTAGLKGYTIHSATLTASEYSSADWSCTNTYPVSLYLSDNISGLTTWNNPPTDTALNVTRQVGGSGSAGCSGDVPFAYDVTSTIAKAAARPWALTTFGLYGDESNANALKRLTTTPKLDVQYDATPADPTAPTANPVPSYTSAGTTQPCEPTTNPTTTAFMGNPGAPGITLTATVSSPVSQPVRAAFNLWDDSVAGFPDTPNGNGFSGYRTAAGPVSFSIPSSDLTDGHAYAWDAAASDGLLYSANTTAVCHFRADLTAPTAAFTSSTDFPPAGSGNTTAKFAGQPGQIPFTATDPAPAGSASGIGCLRWGTDSQLAGSTWQCGAKLPSSSVTVTPGHWGTNIEYIQSMDNAGNTSPIGSYAYYVPWNPHGPAPVFGDITGDGSADILAAGSDGNLYTHTVPGNTQATSPNTALAAVQANSPGHDSWANYHLAHRGSLRGGMPVDDVLVHKDADPNLYLYVNPGNTGNTGTIDFKATLDKPACVPTTTNCAGYAANWSTTTAILATGDVSTTGLNPNKKFLNRTGLLTEEANATGDDALWFYPAVSDGVLGAPVLLSATHWKNWDLIAPGDWAAQGHPGFWARSRTTGDLEAYTLTTGTLSTVDPFGDPTTVPTLTAISAGQQIATGFTAAAYPLIGSDGDLTGDSIPDLWATNPSANLQVWPGTTADTTSKTALTGFTTPVAAGSAAVGADQWPLAKTTSEPTGLKDTAALNAASTSATGVTWGANHKATANSAVTLDGTSGYLHTSTSAFDTTKSYSVSAWVKLNNLTATQTVVSEGTVNHQAFYLGYTTATNSWYYMTTTSDTPSTSYPSANGGTATAGVWTHLTAVYDADTNSMSLYVNGKLVGAADDTTPAYNSSAPLIVGGNTTMGSTTPYNQVNGSIADVRTYPQALTSEQISNLYTTT